MTQDELKQSVAQAALKYAQEGVIGVVCPILARPVVDELNRRNLIGAEHVVLPLREVGRDFLRYVNVRGEQRELESLTAVVITHLSRLRVEHDARTLSTERAVFAESDNLFHRRNAFQP